MKIIILVWIEELELQPLPGPSATIFDSLDQKSWLRHIASKDYKARFYDPVIKRFLNTDPIGYGDGLNMYAYVGGDPINGSDPSGMLTCTNYTRYRVTSGEDENGTWTQWTHVDSWAECESDPNDGIINTNTPNGGGVGGPSGSSTNSDSKKKEKENNPCPDVDPGNMGTSNKWQVAIRRPHQVWTARKTGIESSRRTESKFSPAALHNGSGDAWRHFRWNFAMTQTIGSEGAQAFANAYEVSNPNVVGEHRMDMYNNAMGRAFGEEPAYSAINPDDAADFALGAGCLQTMVK